MIHPDVTLQLKIRALDFKTQDLSKQLTALQEQILEHKENIPSSFLEETEWCNEDPHYFTQISQKEFRSGLVYWVNILIKQFVPNHEKLRDLLSNKFSPLQLRAFILKFSSQILFLSSSARKLHIEHLLSCISIDHLKEAIKVTSQNALQSDAVFSLAVLINATLSLDKDETAHEGFFYQLIEKGKELGSFFGDDIHQILQAYETLDQSPTNAQDALSFLSGQMIILQHMQVLVPAAVAIFPVAIPALLLLPIAGSVARKMYFNWFLTAPHDLSPFVLYSKKEPSSLSHQVIGRDMLFDKIQYIWSQKKHPILVGEPGSGKSTLLAELGRRISLIQMKDFDQDTVVFGGSSFSLVEQEDTTNFQRVIQKAVVYKEHVIVAFDEAHAFAPNRAMNLLKSALDNSKGSLRYAIFATTPTGYNELCDNDSDGALARRMTKIDLEILDKGEMFAVIKNEAQGIAPLLQLTESAIDSIYKRANGKMNDSRQLLHRVLTKVETHNSTSESNNALDKTKTELHHLTTELKSNLLGHNPTNAHLKCQQIFEIQKQITELQDKSIERELARNNHEYLCQHAYEIKNTIIRLSQEINYSFLEHLKQKKIKLENFSSEEQFRKFNEYIQGEEPAILMSEFLFYSYLYGSPLIKTLEKLESDNGFIRIIDEHFVNQVE